MAGYLDKDGAGIIAEKINELNKKTAGKYTLPEGGIPETDLSQEVKDKLNSGGEQTYDTIISTQKEFEAWYAELDAGTYEGSSVLILSGTYTRSDGKGLHLPDTLKQLHGLGEVKIEITNFSYNSSSNNGGIWYTTTPTTKEYSIENISLSCNGSGGSYGFYKCTNLTNCAGNGSGNYGEGFSNCTNLTNCTGNGSSSDSSGYGFYKCTNLTNCAGNGSSSGTDSYDNGEGFFECTNLTNCTGSGRSSGGNGYGFYKCKICSNCRQDPNNRSTSATWSNDCTNVDPDTCPEWVDTRPFPPTPTSSDNGKLLGVTDTKLAYVDSVRPTYFKLNGTPMTDTGGVGTKYTIATSNLTPSTPTPVVGDTVIFYTSEATYIGSVTAVQANAVVAEVKVGMAGVSYAWNDLTGKPAWIGDAKPTYTKAEVGLGNVTNDAQVKRSEMGVANGVAQLDAQGKVPNGQLPAYVDDVIEYDKKALFPEFGEDGKIYVAEDTNITYRWSGKGYVEISPSLALGDTAQTAYAGNKGKANEDAITALQTRATSIESKNSTQDTAISQAQAKADAAMPKSGGQFTGRVSWNATSLPSQDTAPYFVTIESFASGGKTYYTSKENVKSDLGITALEGSLSELREEFDNFTYKTPTLTLTLVGETTAVDLTSDSLTRKITGYKFTATSVDKISGNLAFSGEGASDSVAPVASGSKTLTTAVIVTFSSTKTSATFTLAGTSVKSESIRATASISSYYPLYYGALATTPTASTITSLQKRQGNSGSVSVTYKDNEYVWFCTTGSISKVTSGGFDVPLTQASSISFKGGTYKLYRTELLKAGSQTFIIS